MPLLMRALSEYLNPMRDSLGAMIQVVFARREVSIPGDPYETDVDANDPDEREDEGIGNGSKK